MKTIAITITHGLMARNMLRTDVFRILKANAKIVLVVIRLFGMYHSIKKEFEGKTVRVLDWPHTINPVEWLLRKIADVVFFNVNHVETIRIKDEVMRRENSSKYWWLRLMRTILGGNRNLITALEKFDEVLFRYKCKKYWALFGDDKPDLVFSTDFLCTHEWGLIKAARHHNIPVIAMVPSWDHLTTKGRLPTKFDKVIVWNNSLKRQLVDYYCHKPDEIFVSGIPQFDYYVQDRNKLSLKAKFLQNIGVATNEKLITYTTSPTALSPFEQDIIEIICKAIKNGKIKHPSHLHVRFHPADNFGRYEKIKKYGDIVTFETPGKSASRLRYAWHPDRADMLHYANLLFHSDVVINVCSTVTIDASAFDTPIINIAFDGCEKRPYWDSTARYYDYTHYKPIVKTRGTKIARNKEELIKYINEYLENPELDNRGRKRIVKALCHKLDGKAGERIGTYILNLLRKEEVGCRE